MVPLLARMAVIIKANQQTPVMMGNYEMAYACGLMSRLANVELPEFETPEELRSRLLELLEYYETEDKRELQTIHMLKFYIPDDNWDEQTALLLEMGKREEKIWIR